jgi:hypothetical protein
MTDEKTQIIIGRMKKRVAKLQQQRDHFREQCENYRAVLNLHPSLEYRHKTWTEHKAERERVRGLEQRIKEQAALIEKLSATPTPIQWREAVLDELANCCMDAPPDEPPRSILKRVIQWHIAVALDPAVSAEAQALIDKTVAAAVERIQTTAIVDGEAPEKLLAAALCRVADIAKPTWRCAPLGN